MHKAVILILTAAILFSCTDKGRKNNKATASDTITNVTNPGVGSASDDTTAKH